MFKKLTAIEPVNLVPWGERELDQYAESVVLYDNIPADEDEIIRRIGDSDGVLLSYTSRITRHIFENCPNIRYVGMCCSLYSEESANVDIAYARQHGITVYGIRDYGDRGVVEFVLCELVRLLHGYDRPMWKEQPVEITDLKTGIIGMGVSGGMLANALQFMGAEVSYYSRSRKPVYEEKGMKYMELLELLKHCDVILTCLNKNVILLHEEEFHLMGTGKILFNTSIGPSFDEEALVKWAGEGTGERPGEGTGEGTGEKPGEGTGEQTGEQQNRTNYIVCDTVGALGKAADKLKDYPNVICPNVSAGRTMQAFELLSRKVLDNIKRYQNQDQNQTP